MYIYIYYIYIYTVIISPKVNRAVRVIFEMIPQNRRTKPTKKDMERLKDKKYVSTCQYRTNTFYAHLESHNLTNTTRNTRIPFAKASKASN